ncbi:hypothetical protein ACJX0J_038285, partial [Zea mays]
NKDVATVPSILFKILINLQKEHDSVVGNKRKIKRSQCTIFSTSCLIHELELHHFIGALFIYYYII